MRCSVLFLVTNLSPPSRPSPPPPAGQATRRRVLYRVRPQMVSPTPPSPPPCPVRRIEAPGQVSRPQGCVNIRYLTPPTYIGPCGDLTLSLYTFLEYSLKVYTVKGLSHEILMAFLADWTGVGTSLQNFSRSFDLFNLLILFRLFL